MALTYTEVTAPGGVETFTVPFGYIDREHVHVFVDAVENTTFTWDNSTTVRISPTPAGGSKVRIQRNTPAIALSTVYTNATILDEVTMNESHKELFYIVQETAENSDVLSVQAAVLEAQQAAQDAQDAIASVSLPDIGASVNGDVLMNVAGALAYSRISGVPIGTVVPYFGGYFGDAENGSFSGTVNSAATVDALLNTDGWYVCDGKELNVGGSLYFDGVGRFVPNLAGSRFLMGASSSGAVGGTNSMAHTHTMKNHTHHLNGHTHSINHYHHVDIGQFNTGAHELTIAQMPRHRHTNGIVGYTGSAVTGFTGIEEGPRSTAYYTGYTGGGTTDVKGAGHTHLVNPPNTATTVPIDAANTGQNNGATRAPNDNTTDGASITENRPAFLSAIFIIKVF